jgi:hypothetical protein
LPDIALVWGTKTEQGKHESSVKKPSDCYECVVERGQLLAQRFLGEVGEDLGVGGAGHERVERGRPETPEQIRLLRREPV